MVKTLHSLLSHRDKRARKHIHTHTHIAPRVKRSARSKGRKARASPTPQLSLPPSPLLPLRAYPRSARPPATSLPTTISEIFLPIPSRSCPSPLTRGARVESTRHPSPPPHLSRSFQGRDEARVLGVGVGTMLSARQPGPGPAIPRQAGDDDPGQNGIPVTSRSDFVPSRLDPPADGARNTRPRHATPRHGFIYIHGEHRLSRAGAAPRQWGRPLGRDFGPRSPGLFYIPHAAAAGGGRVRISYTRADPRWAAGRRHGAATGRRRPLSMSGSQLAAAHARRGGRVLSCARRPQRACT